MKILEIILLVVALLLLAYTSWCFHKRHLSLKEIDSIIQLVDHPSVSENEVHSAAGLIKNYNDSSRRNTRRAVTFDLSSIAIILIVVILNCLF